ncbi:WYL domain-containing protein [Thalassobacillus hwangdonensis]|uniref:WYL domain-containing protein n=1 Tax=Thalassobacillus hwangdonensis TaxID=546108 RepID=A0ABW3KXY6_9BACI
MSIEQIKWSTVELIYLSMTGEITKRTVNIFSKSDKEITGYCHMRGDIRTFIMDQILAVQPGRTE